MKGAIFIAETKLHDNQMYLLQHLSQFEVLDYLSCIRMLDEDGNRDRVKLSYAFRPLTKNKYVVKRKDGSVRILTKGKALFPEIEPLVTVNGSAVGIRRAETVSRVAMYLAEQEIYSYTNEQDEACFVPSACWRKIRAGILSTTRFAGILFIGTHRLAVYDIGDGNIEWQMKAEHSLFYRNHGYYATRATGMLLICNDDKRIEIAQRIIRTTMWNRKQLIGRRSTQERERPVRYVKAPIRLAHYYERVYLTTPDTLEFDLHAIFYENDEIERYRDGNSKINDPNQGDYEIYPTRYFVNTTTDLLKYVYYFATMKNQIEFHRKIDAGELYSPYLVNYAIRLPQDDFPILRMYPDVLAVEGAEFYEH